MDIVQNCDSNTDALYVTANIRDELMRTKGLEFDFKLKRRNLFLPGYDQNDRFPHPLPFRNPSRGYDSKREEIRLLSTHHI
jgi:hypothetical protein